MIKQIFLIIVSFLILAAALATGFVLLLVAGLAVTILSAYFMIRWHLAERRLKKSNIPFRFPDEDKESVRIIEADYKRVD